jgi:formate-dependent nitrite reductase cytochrome c552 subunit
MKAAPPRLTARDSRRIKPADGDRHSKRAAPIYATPEYRAWRAEVIRRSGGRCQDKNHDPQRSRSGKLYADHVKELRDGGAPFDVRNGLARCASCHERKTIEARVARLKA